MGDILNRILRLLGHLRQDFTRINEIGCYDFRHLANARVEEGLDARGVCRAGGPPPPPLSLDLRILVSLVMYYSGYVSLEHLLLSWHS